MPSVSVTPPPFVAPETLVESSWSLPISGTVASPLVETVAQAAGEPPTDDSAGTILAGPSSQVAEKPNLDVSNV